MTTATPKLTNEIVIQSRIGLDPLNLIDFPFATTNDNPTDASAVLRFDDVVRDPDGNSIERIWTVRGIAEYGLPLAWDETLFVILMEIWREQGAVSNTVAFSRYDVAKKLGIQAAQGRAYRRIRAGMKRLKGCPIEVQNAFYNSKTKKYGDLDFSIINHIEWENEDTDLEAPSAFEWNKHIAASIRDDRYVKNLDVAFFLSLQSALGRRLYRYLDKRRYDGKDQLPIDIFRLCHKRMGMPKTYRYAGKLAEKLESAHQELVDKKFLECMPEIKKTVDGSSYKVIYRFRKKNAGKPSDSTVPKVLSTEPTRETKIAGALHFVGVNQDRADELARDFTEEAEKQLDYWPFRDKATILDCGAFMHKAIKGAYAAPTAWITRQEMLDVEKKRDEARKQKEIEVGIVQKSVEDQASAVEALWDRLDEEQKADIIREAEKQAGPMYALTERARRMRIDTIRKAIVTSRTA